MSYMKPDQHGRQYIYQDIHGNLNQILATVTGSPSIVYAAGSPVAINEAIALMTALDDFLTSQGVKITKSKKLLEKDYKLRFNGKTQLELQNALPG